MWCLGEGISWWSWFSGLSMLVIAGGVIGLIVWFVTRRDCCTAAVSKHEAMDIAKGRYARGEITREEYEQFRKDL